MHLNAKKERKFIPRWLVVQRHLTPYDAEAILQQLLLIDPVLTETGLKAVSLKMLSLSISSIILPSFSSFLLLLHANSPVQVFLFSFFWSLFLSYVRVRTAFTVFLVTIFKLTAFRGRMGSNPSGFFLETRNVFVLPSNQNKTKGLLPQEKAREDLC